MMRSFGTIVAWVLKTLMLGTLGVALIAAGFLVWDHYYPDNKWHKTPIILDSMVMGSNCNSNSLINNNTYNITVTPEVTVVKTNFVPVAKPSSPSASTASATSTSSPRTVSHSGTFPKDFIPDGDEQITPQYSGEQVCLTIPQGQYKRFSFAPGWEIVNNQVDHPQVMANPEDFEYEVNGMVGTKVSGAPAPTIDGIHHYGFWNKGIGNLRVYMTLVDQKSAQAQPQTKTVWFWNKRFWCRN